MSNLQLILVTLAAFVLVLHATAVTAIEVDKELMDKGYEEIAKGLPPAAMDFAEGLMEAVKNGEVDQEYLKGLGEIFEVLFEGAGDLAAGALGV